jgi:hypothetical protein
VEGINVVEDGLGTETEEERNPSESVTSVLSAFKRVDYLFNSLGPKPKGRRASMPWMT